MSLLRVAYNPTTRVANVAAANAAVPGGSVNIGTFNDPDLTYPDSVVIFHGVRDLLYKRSHANPANAAMFPENITDMDRVTITKTPVIPVTAFEINATAGNIAVAGTRQITPTFLPADATNKTVTYASSNTGVATVNSSGLVTGVAAGTAVITATAGDNGMTDTISVTVA